jgi:hypothetical protein
VLKPSQESHESQLTSLLATIPIRMAELTLKFTLNPSLLQLFCSDEPVMRDFHVALPAVVALNCPSAITLYSELAA